jgi:hypothetical protein
MSVQRAQKKAIAALRQQLSQGLLEVCPSQACPGVVFTLACAGTAFPLWPPIPPPRLLREPI